MKNVVLKVALGLSLASAAALAQGAFVGVEGDYSFNSNLTAKSDNGKSKAKKAQPGLGIKAGYDFDVARVYGGYFYHTEAKDNFNYTDDGVKHDVSIKWTTHKFVVGGDYTPAITDNFKLIAGLYTGVSVVNFKARLYTNTLKATYDTTKAGWLVGTRLGAEYSFDKNNALEFGIKADRSWYSTDEDLDNLKSTDIGAYLGYTYKF